MPDREKVIKGLECCMGYGIEDTPGCEDCPYNDMGDTCERIRPLYEDALALLKAQEQRHRLEVHNIGNVDVPEGVTWEQFQAVMSGVVKALEHTDRGESWPYDPNCDAKMDKED